MCSSDLTRLWALGKRHGYITQVQYFRERWDSDLLGLVLFVVLVALVVPYLLIGAGIGALIYGVVPGEWIATMAGADNPFAIPVAAAIGVPLYIRAETLIPIGMALQSQGMSIGAVAALIIAGAGASIPEVTLLNTIFRPRLVAVFVLTIFTVAISVGYVANLLFI